MLCLFKQRRNGCIEDAATTRNTLFPCVLPRRMAVRGRSNRSQESLRPTRFIGLLLAAPGCRGNASRTRKAKDSWEHRALRPLPGGNDVWFFSPPPSNQVHTTTNTPSARVPVFVTVIIGPPDLS